MVPRFLRSAEHELALLGHAALALQHAVAGEHPWIIAALGWAGPALGALAALFAILVLVGTVLSHLTLRSAEVWSDESARRTATLRRTYTAVLFFISALYYFLLPLVIVGAFGSVGLLIQGIFLVGWLPSTVAQVIGLLLVVSAAAFSKNFFSRWREGEFGVRVGLDRESALLATLQEVAAHIGTRAVD